MKIAIILVALLLFVALLKVWGEGKRKTVRNGR
jgi:hypothetical protein